MSKKMKKMTLAAVLLVAIMVTGCSKPETNTANNKKKDAINETKKEVEKEVEKEAEVPYEQGVRTDTTYDNKALNIKFTVPEGYIMATAEKMAEFLGEGLDAQNLTEAQKIAADQLLQEMVAYSPTDGSNVTIIAEKLPLAAMTEKQYIQVAIDTAVKANASGQIEVQAFGEITEEQLGGQSFLKGAMKMTTQGVTLVQEMYVKKVGSYMVVISLGYMEGNEAAKNTMAGVFQPAA